MRARIEEVIAAYVNYEPPRNIPSARKETKLESSSFPEILSQAKSTVERQEQPLPSVPPDNTDLSARVIAEHCLAFCLLGL